MANRVLIGAPCGKSPVFAEFYDAFFALDAPIGSKKVRAEGGNIPANLNLLAEQAITEGYSHLFVVEDDSSFAPDTLTRLLWHNKPVVTGLCRSRQSPFVPYIYSGVDKDGALERRMLTQTDKGLIRCAATGMGGILIQTDVLKRLSKPYFYNYCTDETLWGQDIIFMKKLIVAQVKVFCDLDVIINHATQCVLGTEQVDGVWCITIRISGMTIHVPQGY